MAGARYSHETGQRRHADPLRHPGESWSAGDGGSTSTPIPLSPPSAYVQIVTATGGQERIAAGAVVATATHEIRMPYHAGVTTQTVITCNGARYAVIGVDNPEKRNRETVCTVAELVD
jgi:SPP1 family predicted phage head-tail adaptor